MEEGDDWMGQRLEVWLPRLFRENRTKGWFSKALTGPAH
jgi:hypothetical protein